MSEEQKEYNGKSITYTELSKFVYGFELQKIFENGHKDNILGRDIINLIDRCKDERHERYDAFREWFDNPTEENAINFFREVADEKVFLNAIVGVVAGYKNLIRE